MIKREWIRYYHRHEIPDWSWKTKILMSVDTAAKDGAQNDYSVITTFQVEDGVYYLLDVTRGRFDYPLLRSTVIELAKRFKPTWVLIEDASTGIALAQELKPILRRPVELVKVEHNKIIRLFVQQQKFAAGLIRFPKGAAFMPELERELTDLPSEQGRRSSRQHQPSAQLRSLRLHDRHDGGCKQLIHSRKHAASSPTACGM